MSITSSGVRLNRRKGIFFLALFAVAELVLSILLVVSLGANLVFPSSSRAAAGVTSLLSYQGRLTDLSGTTLGSSTGTNYCFEFSIYSDATAGSKLWPSGSPSATTVKVKSGVFNAEIGSADDLSTFDFSQDSTIYLNVRVASQVSGSCSGVSWEQLDV